MDDKSREEAISLKIRLLREKSKNIELRHKLVEEDKKRAESYGNAVSSQRPSSSRPSKNYGSHAHMDEPFVDDDSYNQPRQQNDRRKPGGSRGEYGRDDYPDQERAYKQSQGRNYRQQEGDTRYDNQQRGHGRNYHSRDFDREDALHRRYDDARRDGRRNYQQGYPPDSRRTRGSQRPHEEGRTYGQQATNEQQNRNPPMNKRAFEREQQRKHNVESMDAQLSGKIQRGDKNFQEPGGFLKDPSREGDGEFSRNPPPRSVRYNPNDSRSRPGNREYGGQGGKMDRMLEMSGRERQDYDRWKKQQDEADRMRIARSQTDGHWKRDWDTEKKVEDFEDNERDRRGHNRGGRRGERYERRNERDNYSSGGRPNRREQEDRHYDRRDDHRSQRIPSNRSDPDRDSNEERKPGGYQKNEEGRKGSSTEEKEWGEKRQGGTAAKSPNSNEDEWGAEAEESWGKESDKKHPPQSERHAQREERPPRYKRDNRRGFRNDGPNQRRDNHGQNREDQPQKDDWSQKRDDQGQRENWGQRRDQDQRENWGQRRDNQGQRDDRGPRRENQGGRENWGQRRGDQDQRNYNRDGRKDDWGQRGENQVQRRGYRGFRGDDGGQRRNDMGQRRGYQNRDNGQDRQNNPDSHQNRAAAKQPERATDKSGNDDWNKNTEDDWGSGTDTWGTDESKQDKSKEESSICEPEKERESPKPVQEDDEAGFSSDFHPDEQELGEERVQELESQKTSKNKSNLKVRIADKKETNSKTDVKRSTSLTSPLKTPENFVPVGDWALEVEMSSPNYDPSKEISPLEAIDNTAQNTAPENEETETGSTKEDPATSSELPHDDPHKEEEFDSEKVSLLTDQVESSKDDVINNDEASDKEEFVDVDEADTSADKSDDDSFATAGSEGDDAFEYQKLEEESDNDDELVTPELSLADELNKVGEDPGQMQNDASINPSDGADVNDKKDASFEDDVHADQQSALEKHPGTEERKQEPSDSSLTTEANVIEDIKRDESAENEDEFAQMKKTEVLIPSEITAEPLDQPQGETHVDELSNQSLEDCQDGAKNDSCQDTLEKDSDEPNEDESISYTSGSCLGKTNDNKLTNHVLESCQVEKPTDEETEKQDVKMSQEITDQITAESLEVSQNEEADTSQSLEACRDAELSDKNDSLMDTTSDSLSQAEQNANRKETGENPTDFDTKAAESVAFDITQTLSEVSESEDNEIKVTSDEDIGLADSGITEDVSIAADTAVSPFENNYEKSSVLGSEVKFDEVSDDIVAKQQESSNENND